MGRLIALWAVMSKIVVNPTTWRTVQHQKTFPCVFLKACCANGTFVCKVEKEIVNRVISAVVKVSFHII